MKDTQPTTAAAWRKPRAEGFLITLPSGNVARLRPIALDALITKGRLPDLLSPIAAKTLWSEQDVSEIGNAPELASGFADLVNFVVPLAFMEPKVIAEGDPLADEISLDDIEFDDKLTVFNLVISGATTLSKFRDKQRADVDALSNGKGDGKPSKRTVRTKRSVAKDSV